MASYRDLPVRISHPPYEEKDDVYPKTYQIEKLEKTNGDKENNKSWKGGMWEQEIKEEGNTWNANI